ncbi:MAG: tetratricopeptide repeat protein [Longimicrobiales bacterium]
MDAQVAQIRQQARQAFDRREYAAALEQFLSIAEQHPNFADIRHFAGLCQSFLGNAEGALEQFDYALAANPAYVEAHINRALTLNELGRFDEARHAFDLAGHFEQEVSGEFPAAVTARLANAHAGLGDLYFGTGAFGLAADQFRRALQLRPRFHDIRNKLAQALLELGQTEHAASELRAVLESNPRFQGARMNLGLAYFRLGHRDRARREWELTASQDPDNPQVRAYLAMLGSVAPL